MSRVALIAGGYLVAFGLACAVVAVHVAFTSGPVAQASSGMLAFGDGILFLGVFGLAAIPPTGAALYFLRPFPAVWRIASVCVLAITATAPIAMAEIVAERTGGSVLGAWSPAAPLRVLGAVFLAPAFLFFGVFAPVRFARLVFFSATALETATFAWAVLRWLG